MQILEGLIQGSPEWKAIRAKYPCASEAPVVMGASKHMTRGELLRLKSTGAEKEFSDYVQRMVLDKGHEAEAGSRAITEEELGEDLFPVTALSDDGEYLASFDGVPMGEQLTLECKQWNEELAAQVRACDLDPHYYWQLEHQLLVSESAEKVLFVCSDGSRERRVQMEYRRVPGRAEQLRAGWQQFYHDLAHGDNTPAPAKAVAPPVEALPIVQVNMGGTLTVTSNLDAFGKALRAFIERIPAKPNSDEDFALTDVCCKTLKKTEEALESEEGRALASMADVEQMRRLVGELRNLARTTRLQREKLVEARKLEIRSEEIARGKQALAQFIAGLNATIGKPYMPVVPCDFTTAIKGKKTVQSLRDAVDQHLADCKLAANDVAGRITVNMRALRELAAEHAFLFADAATLVLKPLDDCRAAIVSRIAEHRATEERRAAELAERERARIRAEEEARAQRLAHEDAARAELERRARAAAEETQRRQEAAAATPAATPAPSPAPAPAATTVQAFAENVHLMPTRAPAAPASPPTLRLGQINDRLAPVQLTADGLRSLGFEPAGKNGAALMYHEGTFDAICAAVVKHATNVAAQQRAA